MFITYAIVTAITAYVYSHVLTADGMILSKWYEFVRDVFPNWIYKPVIGCCLCVSGQFAFWTFPLFFEWELFHHIAYVCVTILTTKLIYTYDKEI